MTAPQNEAMTQGIIAIQGCFMSTDPIHIILVEAPYYAHISELLRAGVVADIQEHDCRYETIQVAGALEIPGAISMIEAGVRNKTGQRQKFDGYIALGCVIRGETSHYEIVCQESCRGLMDLSLRNIAVANGILTVENEQQAIARADRQKKNRGGAVAEALLGMIALKRAYGT